jgi:hypothetical protein
MGTGGSKAHESFSIATTAPAPEPEAEPDDGPPAGSLTDLGAAAVEAVATWTPDGKPLPDAYQDLTESVEAAKVLLEGNNTELAATVHQMLNNLPAEDLQELAAAQGFEHPTLVGFSEDADHPLAHWLNPAYPPGIASKAKISAKAEERYETLAAGGTVNGLTLADVQAAEAALHPAAPPEAGPEPEGAWTATPEQIAAAQIQVGVATAKLDALGPDAPAAAKTAAVAELLIAEDHLATAQCPELGDHLVGAKSVARTAVDDALAPHIHDVAVVGPLVKGAEEAGQLGVWAPAVLSGPEGVALLRANTPAAERAALNAAYETRVAQLAAHSVNRDTYDAAPLPGALKGKEAQQALVAHAKAAGALAGTQGEIDQWHGDALLPHKGYGKFAPTAHTTQFSKWAKEQSLAELRTTAGALGLEHAAHAGRTEATSYIAATWDAASPDKASIATSVAAKAHKAAAASASPAPSPGRASPPAGSFGAKHLALVQAIKHHTAAAAALPERVPAATVENWKFTDGPVQSLGGAHTKTFHTAPDGSVWMFKPDKTAGGARAHAEAAASNVFTRVGVPAVPVYAKRLGRHTGSIQPIVAKTGELSPSPSTWSQADVDAMVRLHVAAWAVGDHDGKPDNVLRSAGGGLIPVDQGQAFKFFGRDKLTTSYHPNSSYGAARPVYHQAYLAAKNGGLAAGVHVRPEAAAPVIKAFEAIPDSEYRQLLHATAHEGAANPAVHWHDTMRKSAAKRLGRQPTTSEIAGEFLDHAVTRKQGLRKAFAGFFHSEGVAGHDKLTKVI